MSSLVVIGWPDWGGRAGRGFYLAAPERLRLALVRTVSILGLGRAFQPAKQSRSGLTQALHLPSSFQTASASYEQEIIGAFGNVRKAFGEIRNVEC